MKSKIALSIAAAAALTLVLLFLMQQGFIPGQEYFKIARVEFYDEDGNLIKTFGRVGSAMEWVEQGTTCTGYMVLYPEFRMYVDDSPTPPQSFTLTFTYLLRPPSTAGAFIPWSEQVGDAPLATTASIRVGDAADTAAWVSAGKSRGNPAYEDWVCTFSGIPAANKNYPGRSVGMLPVRVMYDTWRAAGGGEKADLWAKATFTAATNPDWANAKGTLASKLMTVKLYGDPVPTLTLDGPIALFPTFN